MNALSKSSTLCNGKYVITQTLGYGSFGITYLATTKVSLVGGLGMLPLNVTVAIKEFFMKGINSRSSDGNTVEASNSPLITYYKKKFHQEAELLSKLDHANIVKVLDVFDENNTTYYVMQYIEGETLDEYVRQRGHLSEQETMKAFFDIGNALQYMHEHNMLHLDIKPRNIIREKDGRMILIDFGLSKQYDENGVPESSTTIGAGTPGYAPLEQAHFKQDGSFPATLDIYALGATLFKMLTGAPPPYAEDLLEEGFPKHLFRDAGISDSLASMVEKAMCPMKKKRFQSIKEMMDHACLSQAEITKRKVEDFGSYKQYIGEAEYGTLETVYIPVTDPLPMPDSVKIEYHPLAPGQLFFTFCLNSWGCNTAFVARTKKGGKTVLFDEDIAGGISSPTIEALKRNGFFSKEHWEMECSTWWAQEDDINVACTFSYKDGSNFVRKVPRANHLLHDLLLSAVEDLMKVPQISYILDQAENRESYPRPYEWKEFGFSIFTIQQDLKTTIYHRGMIFHEERLFKNFKNRNDAERMMKSQFPVFVIDNDCPPTICYLENYINICRKELAKGYNIITYRSVDDYLKIMMLIKNNPAIFDLSKLCIIHEPQLFPLSLGKNAERLCCYEYEDMFCETQCESGMMEVIRSGFILLGETHISPCIPIERPDNLLLGAVILERMQNEKWAEDELLLPAIPFDIMAFGSRDEAPVVWITAHTPIPCKKTGQINNVDDDILVTINSKGFHIHVEDVFKYKPEHIQLTIKIDDKAIVWVLLIDKEKNKEVKLSAIQLMNHKPSRFEPCKGKTDANLEPTLYGPLFPNGFKRDYDT